MIGQDLFQLEWIASDLPNDVLIKRRRKTKKVTGLLIEKTPFPPGRVENSSFPSVRILHNSTGSASGGVGPRESERANLRIETIDCRCSPILRVHSVLVTRAILPRFPVIEGECSSLQSVQHNEDMEDI